MNDVELIARALLQVEKVEKVEKAKILFSGSKKYGETINLTEDTKKYDILLITFLWDGVRHSVVTTNDTKRTNVCMTYTSNDTKAGYVLTIRTELERIDNNTYIIDFVKRIDNASGRIYLNNEVKDLSVISIVGIL